MRLFEESHVFAFHGYPVKEENNPGGVGPKKMFQGQAAYAKEKSPTLRVGLFG
jgi:hypothetical protein